VVRKAFADLRLRQIALAQVRLEGHDPRNVPSWVGMTAYVEQNFGVWTVPGGMGAFAALLTKRLGERRVEVLTGTTVEDVVVRDGRAVGVAVSSGALSSGALSSGALSSGALSSEAPPSEVLDADVVVCAIDPRALPTLAPLVRRTMPALPPVVCHLGLTGTVPNLASEVVLHGDPTIVLRTTGSAPAGGSAWTLLGRGRVSEDLLVALARRGIDVRDQVAVRFDRSPRELVETWAGSPYGVLWQGRATVDRRLGTTTPVPGLYCAGAHSTPGAGVPFVGLSGALVAQAVGPA
jgi:UDP-galactopyranose mutase